MEFPLWLSRLRTCLSVYEDAGSIPDLAHWVKDLALLRLWCRVQMQLRSSIAMAVVWASNCNSDSTPSQETTMCHRCGPKKQKKKERKLFSNKNGIMSLYIDLSYSQNFFVVSLFI